MRRKLWSAFLLMLFVAVQAQTGVVVFPKRWTEKPPGKVGINWSHPVWARVRPQMVVLINQGFGPPDYIKHIAPGIQGNPTVSALPFLGQTLVCDGNGDGFEWGNFYPKDKNQDITLAAVVRYTGGAVERRFIGTDGPANRGFALTRLASGNLAFTVSGRANTDSGIAMAVNDFLFVVASFSNGPDDLRWVVRNLATGAYSTATGTYTGAPPLSQGTQRWNIGGASVFPTSMWEGEIGMGVIGEGYISDVETLVEWSADPYAIFQPQSPQHRHWTAVVVGARRLMIVERREEMLLETPR